jgi:hypothetical protein
VVFDVSQPFSRDGAVGDDGAVLPDHGDAEVGLLAQVANGGVEQGAWYGRSGLIEQRPESHGG